MLSVIPGVEVYTETRKEIAKMATIQAKISRGHKYWYIVESRRVNGKPRPIVLAYLGKPEDLLRRLKGIDSAKKVKSYSHGAVAALLKIAEKLQVPSIINKHVHSKRKYTAQKPIRNNLTVGMTLLLGAVGRACMPTSKRGWWKWAKTTSCEYLLRCSLSRIDSQHFWDLMDALPPEAIPQIEAELLREVQTHYPFSKDTLLFDATNFFTFIATDNQRCDIAQRGKNKQKRADLRQVGLALVVTREHGIPLFHLTYKGNLHDAKLFAQVVGQIKERMLALKLDLEKLTLVFDKGNNSKKNMAAVANLKLHYVGALTPYHHQGLIDEAEGNYREVSIDDQRQDVYRAKKEIWGEDRTILVFISQRLKAGQLSGIYQALRKKEKELAEIQKALANPRAKKKEREKLEEKISNLAKGQFLKGLIQWSLAETEGAKGSGFRLDFSIDQQKLIDVEDRLGFRILMTNRHEWETDEIVKGYLGQAGIERTFRDMKNPHHLALRPQNHWTDQKIIVHCFICVLSYLLSSILWRQAQSKAKFSGSIDSLLSTLNGIRLAALIEPKQGPGRHKATYQLEEKSPEEDALLQALGIDESHLKRPKFKGVGVYN